MLLKNNLYTILDVTSDNASAVCRVKLVPSCFIYDAHFPGEPVTPGVCIMQMVKEILEEVLSCNLEITNAKNVKFLSVLSPVTDADVICQINKITANENGTGYKVQATVKTDVEVKAKLSLECKII